MSKQITLTEATQILKDFSRQNKGLIITNTPNNMCMAFGGCNFGFDIHKGEPLFYTWGTNELSKKFIKYINDLGHSLDIM